MLSFDVRQGEAVRVEKLVSLYTSRDRAIYEPLTNAGKSVGRYPDFAEALQRHTRAWDELWRSSDVFVPGNERVQHLLRLHISHILQVCSLHTTNHDAGRAGARPQRRGLPRPRLLGRAVRLSLPDLAPAGDHARAAHVPLPAPRRGARGGARGGLQGRDVPVAERQRRQRGDAGRPPQPAVGTVGSGPQPPPAPRQRGDLLQRLALPPGDRRPRLPARPRRRDHARDRALLELDRALQPRARPLRDPRRHGPRRVPREVPRRRPRAACATTPTRTSWWPGSASRRRSCSGC